MTPLRVTAFPHLARENPEGDMVNAILSFTAGNGRAPCPPRPFASSATFCPVGSSAIGAQACGAAPATARTLGLRPGPGLERRCVVGLSVGHSGRSGCRGGHCASDHVIRLGIDRYGPAFKSRGGLQWRPDPLPMLKHLAPTSRCGSGVTYVVVNAPQLNDLQAPLRLNSGA